MDEPWGVQTVEGPSSTARNESRRFAPSYSAGDTRHHDTGSVAAAGTIGRMTPAYYGFGGPPVEHGSSKSCKPGVLPLTIARLVC